MAENAKCRMCGFSRESIDRSRLLFEDLGCPYTTAIVREPDCFTQQLLHVNTNEVAKELAVQLGNKVP